MNNVPESRPRPRPQPGANTRPAPGPGIGDNRPGGNRPGTGANRPGIGDNRPGVNRPDWNNRPNWNRPGWNRPDWVFNRPVNINVVNVRPNWWGPRWYTSRPWRVGWYYGPSRWNWWSSSSLAWGITSLASAAIIASAINNALGSNTSTIDVSDSPYQLVFASVTPVGDQGVSFSFLFEGSAFQATADCSQGLLNNRPPVNQEEAQLINAACQVAFASF